VHLVDVLPQPTAAAGDLGVVDVEVVVSTCIVNEIPDLPESDFAAA
jgi:hypothetical protein